MSTDRYPRLGTSQRWERSKKEKVRCYRCGIDIAVGKPFFVQEIQENWFRGSDHEVTLCPACHAWCRQHNAIPKPLREADHG